MSHLNLNTYSSKQVVKWYASWEEIFPVEKHVFEVHKNFIEGKQVLDIGIGGGRTTNYLLNACGRYVGIDYSKGFVDKVREKYPAADIRHMDARDLSAFEKDSFDFVNFSFNGIDYVDAAGRVGIMTEINRVLKPGGLFFFSTHNKEHPTFNQPAWKNPDNDFWVNLKTYLKLLPYLLFHATQKRKEIITADYAVINDSAHQYRLLTFYTSVSFLRKQLMKHCFYDCVFYSKTGEAGEDRQLDQWIFVTCKKSLP